MSVFLSGEDIARVNAIQALLLNPFTPAPGRCWIDAVLSDCKELLGAQQASLVMPTDANGFEIHADEVDDSALDAYHRHYGVLDSGITRVHELGLEVSGWSQLHDTRQIRKTEFYNDFIVKYRLFDALAIHPSPGPGLAPWMAFHHDSSSRKEFGERGACILSLLLPAFRAGMQMRERFGKQLAHLTTVIDTTSDGVVVLGPNGRLFENSAYAEMLREDPERVSLETAISRLAKTRNCIHVEHPIESTVRTTIAAYRIRATSVPEETFGPEPIRVVLVERTSGPTLSADFIQKRWQLTPREAEVALLLAEGLTNAAIVERLCISARTARTHTEHILMKLQVSSRAAVGARLRSR